MNISKSEEHWLDEFAKSSEFWASVRAKYAEFDGLTPRQYEILTENIERNEWKKDASKVAGVPVRNKFKTRDGKPKCADRTKPYCDNVATIVVGTYGYCQAHVDEARDNLQDWIDARAEERLQDAQPANDVLKDDEAI